MDLLHKLNIGIHVAAGILALLVGFIIIFIRKGNRKHIRFGRWFLLAISLVILTGLIGVFVFKRNTFLLVITLLSAYNAFSGVRIMRLRGRRPALLDAIITLIVLSAAGYYIYYIRSMGMFWAPVIIYSTICALVAITLYDLSRFLISTKRLNQLYLFEHIYKMVSSLIAVTSAFTGTVLPQYQPYSQILPTVFGLMYITGACIYYRPKSLIRNSVS